MNNLIKFALIFIQIVNYKTFIRPRILYILMRILIDLLLLTYKSVWFCKWVIWHLQISGTYGKKVSSHPILAM